MQKHHNHIHHCKGLFIITLFFACIQPLIAQNSADTTTLNGKVKAIEALSNSQEFATVYKLSHELIDSATAIGYTDAIGWGEYYLSISFYKNDDIDSSIYYAKSAYRNFVKSKNIGGQSKALSSTGLSFHFKPCYDSSIHYFNHAIAVANMLKTDSLLLAEPYHGLGLTYTITGEHNIAMEYLIKSLRIFQKYNYTSKEAYVLNSMGVLLKHRGDLHNALEFYFKALSLYEKVNDIRGISYQHNNIGIILNELKDYNNALEHFTKSISIKNTINDRRGISNSLMNIGYVFLSKGDFNNALSHLDQSEAIKNQINDKSGLALLYLYKGITYCELKLYDKSLLLLDMALNTYQQFNDVKGIANTKIQLSIVNYKIGKYNNSFQLLDEVTESTKNSDMFDITVLINKTYYEIYNSINDCSNSLLFFKKYIALRDSASSLENIRKMLTLQMRLEYEDVIKMHVERNDIKLQNAEKDKSKNAKIALFFIIAFGSTIVILILFVYTIKNKQKINDKLGLKQVEIEEQKQKLIVQRDDLEIQKNLVIYQRDRIINMLTDIGESIDYAKKIQQAILPTNETMLNCFKDFFIINQPKDSVGGDFYWAGLTNNKHIVFAAADSTGHGVPGGFMSMLCISMIIEIVARNLCDTPAEALENLRTNIIATLGQHGEDNDNTDGMDIAFCVYRPESRSLFYAGANLSIFVATKQKITLNDKICKIGENLYELKPDRMPISYFDPMLPFNNIEIQLVKNDIVYMFSDGYTDQFGGEKGKKFGHSATRDLINSIKDLPLNEQKQILWTTIEKWKGVTEIQTDDILVMGLQLK